MQKILDLKKRFCFRVDGKRVRQDKCRQNGNKHVQRAARPYQIHQKRYNAVAVCTTGRRNQTVTIFQCFRGGTGGATTSFFLSDFFCFRCGYRSTVPRGSKRRKNSRLKHLFHSTLMRQFFLPPLTSALYFAENVPFTVPCFFRHAENGKK